MSTFWSRPCCRWIMAAAHKTTRARPHFREMTNREKPWTRLRVGLQHWTHVKVRLKLFVGWSLLLNSFLKMKKRPSFGPESLKRKSIQTRRPQQCSSILIEASLEASRVPLTVPIIICVIASQSGRSTGVGGCTNPPPSPRQETCSDLDWRACISSEDCSLNTHSWNQMWSLEGHSWIWIPSNLIFRVLLFILINNLLEPADKDQVTLILVALPYLLNTRVKGVKISLWDITLAVWRIYWWR